MKKQILSFLLLFACAISASALKPVKEYGQLQVIGSNLCDQNGNPVMLRGISLGWHNLWPRFYNKKAVSWLINDWHATVIRAAMGVQIYDNYIDNPEFTMKCITPVIEAAIKNDTYVIIDWHAHQMKTKEAVEFFGKMAKKYGKYPHVIYELFNEPEGSVYTWEELKVYAAACINEIRKHDPDNIILMGSPHWDQDLHLVAESPLQGFSNIMYTMHFYAATHGKDLKDRTVAAIKKGIPVFVSECGCSEASGNGRLGDKEFREWEALMEQYNISWAAWNLGDKDETSAMLYPRASSFGNWKEDVITPGGKLVRSFLIEKNR